MKWETRVNHSIVGMIVMDGYNFIQGVVHASWKDEDLNEFIYGLASKMIEHIIDLCPEYHTRNSHQEATMTFKSTDIPRQTPTKLMRMLDPSKNCQGRCREINCNQMYSQFLFFCKNPFA